MTRFLGFTLAALVACTTTGPGTGATTSDIVGGTRSTGASSTVLIVDYPQDQSTYYTCTGVVIAPTVVVTAAHCVDAMNHQSYTFGVFTGDDGTPYGASAAAFAPHLELAQAAHAYPSYDPASPFTGDIGVLVMAQPLAVTPAPYARDTSTFATPGTAATIIGYGQTTSGTFNLTRNTADTVTGAVADDTVVVGDPQKHGCLGDSGGGAFVGGVLIGVDSYGPTGCTDASHYRRTDVYQTFLASFVTPPFDDAVHPDAGVDPMASGGCCSTGGGDVAGASALALIVVPVVRRRRRR